MSGLWSMFWFKSFRKFFRKIAIFRNFDHWSEILSLSADRPISQDVCPPLSVLSPVATLPSSVVQLSPLPPSLGEYTVYFNDFWLEGQHIPGVYPHFNHWARICKRLWSPGIDSEESIPPAYVALRAGTTNRVAVSAPHGGNPFLGSLKGLQVRALI